MGRRLRSQQGMTLFTVLLALVVVGLILGLTGQTWTDLMQREREEELYFRGDQYRRAIQSYYEKGHGGAGFYPSELKQLLKDNRQVNTLRHIRKLWRDPFTDDDWELIYAEPNKIKGVRSKSKLTPFQQDGFPEEYATFKGATSYSQWDFVYIPKAVASKKGQTGQPVPNGQTGQITPPP